jgi:hypothetical protein
LFICPFSAYPLVAHFISYWSPMDSKTCSFITAYIDVISLGIFMVFHNPMHEYFSYEISKQNNLNLILSTSVIEPTKTSCLL